MRQRVNNQKHDLAFSLHPPLQKKYNVLENYDNQDVKPFEPKA